MPARLAQQENENGQMEGRAPASPKARHPEAGRRRTSVRQSQEEPGADFGSLRPPATAN
jgi:hypothetical protein